MLRNLSDISSIILNETGLAVDANDGVSAGKQQWVEFTPSGYDAAQTFSVRVDIEWRAISVVFKPGKYSADFIKLIYSAEPQYRTIFTNLLEKMLEDKASVAVAINNQSVAPKWQNLWDNEWQNIQINIRKGQLLINDGNPDEDVKIISKWVSALIAAILSLLPYEDVDAITDLEGYPEGSKKTVTVNKYERDRRNRAAAIAIHGSTCKACGVNLGDVYGSVADGTVEVHHALPVSQMGENYKVDPRRDLIPLCPNCHTIVHKRTPPYSIEELKLFLTKKVASD